MKKTLKTLLVATAFILPLNAVHADDFTMCKPGEHNCAFTDHMNDMQKGMGDMSKKMQIMDEHMQKMMQKTKDSGMKQEMGGMSKDMGGMMQNMQQMHEKMGMMKGMMQQGSTDKKSAAPSSGEDTKDHEKHHPKE